MKKPLKKVVGKSKKKDLFKPRVYTKKQIAGFLLNDAINEAGYRRVRNQVKAMGFDPDSIPHDPPSKLTAPYRESLLKSLTDRTEAAAYLSAALEDAVREKNARLFAIALQDVVEAQGKKLSACRTASRGTPELMTIWKLLDSFGFRLVMVPAEEDPDLETLTTRPCSALEELWDNDQDAVYDQKPRKKRTTNRGPRQASGSETEAILKSDLLVKGIKKARRQKGSLSHEEIFGKKIK